MIFNLQNLPGMARQRTVRRAGNCVIFSLIFSGQICCQAQPPQSRFDLASVKVAAEAGNPAAEDELAVRFMRQGDTSDALVWYGKSAEQGYVPAQGELGDLLLHRARLTADSRADAKSAIGSHAIRWLTLAAYQGDKLGQADLAGACFSGEFVKQDLIGAYQWGDLAAQATPTAPGSISGQTIRESAIPKMSAAQIAEAKRRVATFIPYLPARSEFPEPLWVKEITLTGLSGTTRSPLAIINSVTLGTGDSGVVKVAGRVVRVRCLQIRDKSVLVQIAGLEVARELMLQN